MKKLVILLTLLAALWVVGETAVTSVAETRIEQQVADRTDGEATVSADIDSFPSVTRVLLTGTVDELSITLDSVAGQSLSFSEVRFDLSGVEVDRDAMFQRKLRVTAIDRGMVTARVDTGALPPLAAQALSAASNSVRVSGGSLHVGPVSFVLSSDLLPCAPDVRIEGDAIVLSCAIDDVPPALIDAAQAIG